MTPTQRKNLLKLAAYLESLPRNYKHFDMTDYADHRGECDLGMNAELAAAKEAELFFGNCGTVACAAGHGPAAGVPFRRNEFHGLTGYPRWGEYAIRAFTGNSHDVWTFLFCASWAEYDNHHYGAAARMRFYLAVSETRYAGPEVVREYAPYRKGSRSAKRREIEAVSQ